MHRKDPWLQVLTIPLTALLMTACGGGVADVSLEGVDEATVAESIELRVVVRDSRGEPAPGISVKLSTETAGGLLGVDEVVTDADGRATVDFTVSAQVGANRITAVAGELSASLVVHGTPGEAAEMMVTAAPERVLNGSPTMVRIAVVDGFGNSVPGIGIQLAATSPGASVNVEATETGSDGIAEVELTTAAAPGDNVVEVRAAGLPTQTVAVPGSRLVRMQVKPDDPELASGQELTFEAVGFDADGNEIGIRPEWTVSGDVGTLGGSGVFTAITAGQGEVSATSRGISASSGVTVVPGPARTIAVDPTQVRVASGESVAFQGIGRDAAGNETPLELRWSVSEALGNINDQGMLNARRAGTGTVTATAGNLRGEARVEVTPGPLAMITLAPDDVVLAAGQQATMTMHSRDAAGNEVMVTPAWSLSEAVGEISDAGVLRGVRAGEARLVVTAGGLAASTRVKVTPGPLTSITVSPANPEVPAGTTVRFTAQGRDSEGNDVPVTPEWSVSVDIGEIDAEGVLTTAQVGRGRLVARAGDVAGDTELSVVAGPVTHLEIQPTTVELVAGASQPFVVTGSDAVGNQTTVQQPTWRIDGNGQIGADGVFSGTVAGSVQVSATHGTATVTADVEIVAGPLASIVVTPEALEIDSGSNQQFQAMGKDAYDNDVPVEPTWTVAGTIGAIDASSGSFTAVATGVGSAVATAGSRSGAAAVRVNPGPLASIRVEPPPPVRVHETFQFRWVGHDAEGNEVEVLPSWTVTGGIGAVEPGGLFTAARPGSGKVVARSGGLSGDVGIDVIAGPLASLRISGDSEVVELTSGDTMRFSGVGTDRDGNTVEVQPRWEVEGGLGTIDGAGLFAAGRAGTGILRATTVTEDTSQAVVAQKRLRVVPGSLVSIAVEPDRADVPAGTTRTFLATGRDAHGNALSITPEWSVTPGSGQMDSRGQYTATIVGNATVAAIAAGVVGTAEVTTVPGALSALEILPSDSVVRAGEVVQYRSSGTDAHGNSVRDFATEWGVTGNIGTVDPGRGVFTGVTAGTGEVVARSANIRGTTTIQVVPGDPSAPDSTVFVSPPSVAADGEWVAEVRVTVRDAFENAIAGLPVTLTSNRPDDRLEVSDPHTDERGIVQGQLRTRTPGRSVITARTEGATVATSEPVEFQ